MKKKYIQLIASLALCICSLTTAAQQGNALDFDGVNDQVDCGNAPEVRITGEQITLEARVYTSNFKDNPFQGNIINKIEDGGTDFNRGWALRIGGNGVVNFILGNDNWEELYTPENTLTENAWYHVAATFDGAVMTIYVDGEEVASQTLTAFEIADSTSPLYLGDSFDGNRNFEGVIDEARVWSVARTQEEIQQFSEGSLTGGPFDDLVAYYIFDQGIAGGDNTGEIILIDQAGDNDGELENFSLNGETSNWVGSGTLGIDDFSALENVSVFPIPANENITINGLEKNTSYTIYNSIGQLVKNGEINPNSTIEIAPLNEGIYMLQLEDIGTIKFIKN